LYRALDKLLPHKEALEKHLKSRLGEMFGLEYDLLLYDVTSTYFEGEAKANPKAQRGYSRDKRPDCKQVCIGLVVSKCGMPLGYEVFEGNRTDVTTLREIVEKMERSCPFSRRGRRTSDILAGLVVSAAGCCWRGVGILQVMEFLLEDRAFVLEPLMHFAKKAC